MASPKTKMRHALLQSERGGYESQRKKPPKQGWDDMTQIGCALFDGMQARPFTTQLAGTPKARAKSGARSIANWQRDYNPKGLCTELTMPQRFQRVVKMKQEAAQEAERRQIPVEAVEEEMYQAVRARSTRIDTGLRKDEMAMPSRTYPNDGGPPRLFDGSEKLEEAFNFRDARDMFRGEAWEAMGEELKNLNEFKPPPRVPEEAARLGTRGSFSNPVSPETLRNLTAKKTFTRKVVQPCPNNCGYIIDWNGTHCCAVCAKRPGHHGDKCSRMNATVKVKDDKILGADSVVGLKKLLVRKYGSVSAAWRNCLDFDGNGKLSFAEWSRAMRLIGFEGNIKDTYRQLDEDNSGIVTFEEFDPVIAKKLKEFQSKWTKKYGDDWDAAWISIDDNANNMLDPQEFEEVCELIGYSGKPFELFKELRFHPSRKFLTLEDFKGMPKTDWHFQNQAQLRSI
jgi:hypothetical protein